MHKKKLKVILIITFFLYAIYIIAAIGRSDFWGDLVSPLVGLATFIITFCNYSDIKRRANTSSKIIKLSYSLACLSWAIADIVWAIYAFSPELDPKNSSFIVFLYCIPNICFSLAITATGYILYKKWHTLQLLLDAIAIAFSVSFLLWIVFFNKSIIPYHILCEGGFYSIISICSSMLMMVFTFIWYVSIRKEKQPIYNLILPAGILLYSLVDLYYWYNEYNKLYVPNSFTDVFYLGSFVLIAIGSYLNYYSRKPDTKFVDYEVGYNVGYIRKEFILWAFPLLDLVFEGFAIFDLLIFFIIILIHNIFNIYVQTFIKNEQLLKTVKEMNLLLEDKIQDRTKEITEKNRALEGKNKKLDFLSKQDTVTNLYNRRYFIQTLEKQLKSMQPDETFALLFIDLDRFKLINDMYGHHIGDQVLVEIARRLNTFNFGTPYIARLGGDEFVIGYKGDFDYHKMEQIANQIIKLCSYAIEIGQYVFSVTMSIGISIYPLDATDYVSLMKNADIAMYQAKIQGKKRCVSFNSTFREMLNRKSEIEFQLKTALQNNEFELFYQPQYSIHDKELIGAEALLRWNNKYLGWISPAEFIPIAEEIDVITTIGDWVLENAVKQVSIWNKTYGAKIKIGINVSPKQLDQKTFLAHFKNILECYSVPSYYIDIEITESIAIEGEIRMKQIDSIFHGLGVSISIDDFGTGYSSLSYLKCFPCDRIKIAKQLIDAIATDNFDLQIVNSVVMLAKSIGKKTIAEGVETQEQFDILAELGCDEIQGYYLGKPMSVNEFEKLLQSLPT